MPDSNPITLKDIAEACGVSRNTVSQALRNSPLVAKTTRDAIQSKAAELGYVKDPQLSRIMTQLGERRKRKDVVREEVAYLKCIHTATESGDEKDEPSHPEFFSGAQAFLASQGYRLTSFPFANDKRRVSQLNRIFASRGIRGVIVSPLPPGLDSIDLKWENLAAVALGRQLRQPLIDRVDINYANHCRICYLELRNLGCRRIALSMPRVYDRILNYSVRSTYLGQASLDDPVSTIPILDANFPAHREIDVDEAVSWIEKNRADGVICLDIETPVFRKAINSLKRKVELANLRISNCKTEQGMLPSAKAVGETAAQQLFGDLTFGRYGPPKYPKLIQIAGRWVKRPREQPQGQSGRSIGREDR